MGIKIGINGFGRLGWQKIKMIRITDDLSKIPRR